MRQLMRAAVVALALAAGAAGSPGSGAPAVLRMRVDFGLGGYVRAGRTAPVRVSLDNDGEPLRGELVLTGEDGLDRTAAAVDLPRGARKQLWFYVVPRVGGDLDPSARLDVRLVSGRRTLLQQTGAAKVLTENTALVVSVTGDGSGLQFLEGQEWRPAADAPRTLKLHALAVPPADLPAHWAGLAAVDALALNGGGWAALEPAQRRAVRQWVEIGGWPDTPGGGNVILCGDVPAEWRDEDAAPLLAVEPERTVTLRQLACLAPDLGEAYAPADGALLAIAGPPAGDGTTLLREGAVAVARRRAAGAGTALWIGFDPLRSGFRQWDEADAFWKRALQAVSADDDRLPTAPDPEAVRRAALSAARVVPRLPPPPARTLAALALLYLFLFGPLNVWLVRRARRTLGAWLLTPSLAAGMTLLLIAVGQSWATGRTVLNSATVLQTASGSRAALEQTWLGLFSPTDRAFIVTVDDPAPLFRQVDMPDRGAETSADGALQWPDRLEEGRTTFDRQRQALYTLTGRRVVRAADLGGQVVARRLSEGRFEVRNETRWTLGAVLLAGAGQGPTRVGELAPGSRRVLQPGEGGLASALPAPDARHDSVAAARAAAAILAEAARRRPDDRWLIAEARSPDTAVLLPGVPAARPLALLVVRVEEPPR